MSILALPDDLGVGAYSFVVVGSPLSDLCNQCDVLDMLTATTTTPRRLSASSSLVLASQSFDDAPIERIKLRLDWSPLQKLIQNESSQNRFQVQILGTFSSNLVAKIFHNQNRDVSIFYQPQTFSIHKSSSGTYSVQRDQNAFEGKSCNEYIFMNSFPLYHFTLDPGDWWSLHMAKKQEVDFID